MSAGDLVGLVAIMAVIAWGLTNAAFRLAGLGGAEHRDSGTRGDTWRPGQTVEPTDYEATRFSVKQ